MLVFPSGFLLFGIGMCSKSLFLLPGFRAFFSIFQFSVGCSFPSPERHKNNCKVHLIVFTIIIVRKNRHINRICREAELAGRKKIDDNIPIPVERQENTIKTINTILYSYIAALRTGV